MTRRFQNRSILDRSSIRDWLFTIASIGSCFGSYSNAVGQENANLFFCKSREFSIPFNVGTVGRAPSELELEVSLDGGNNWQLAQRSQPATKSFRYQAPQDGFFLFRLRVIDANGKGSLTSDQPLQVIVDSEKPNGELSVDVDPQGQLVASFMIVEPNLNTESIRLEYRTERDQQWRPIECSLQQGNEAYEIRGTGRWDVPIGTHQLVVRLVAKDQAENDLEVFRYPQLPRTAQGAPLQLASQRSNAIPSRIPPTPSLAIPNQGQNNQPSSALDRTSSLPKGTEAKGAIGTGVPIPDPRRQGPNPGLIPSTEPIALPSVSNHPSSGLNLGSPVPVQETKASPSLSNGKFVLTEVQPGEFEPKKNPPQKQNAPEENAIPSRFEELGIRPYFTNSKTFSLDYELEANPSLGIQAIELWGTTDGGKTWENWGADPDRASPMDVAVEDEGVFGFRIVIASANGLTTNRPLAGDTADVWIQVDSEVPAVKLTSARYGIGPEAGSLIIEYQAHDENLLDRPITLTFSESGAGPWTTIATGIPNNGKYVWQAESNLPKRIYLRIEAIDQASNVGSHQSANPIDVQGLVPRGRIHGVRPIR